MTIVLKRDEIKGLISAKFNTLGVCVPEESILEVANVIEDACIFYTTYIDFLVPQAKGKSENEPELA